MGLGISKNGCPFGILPKAKTTLQVNAHVQAYKSMTAMTQTWRLENNFREPFLAFHLVEAKFFITDSV